MDNAFMFFVRAYSVIAKGSLQEYSEFIKEINEYIQKNENCPYRRNLLELIEIIEQEKQKIIHKQKIFAGDVFHNDLAETLKRIQQIDPYCSKKRTKERTKEELSPYASNDLEACAYSQANGEKNSMSFYPKKANVFIKPIKKLFQSFSSKRDKVSVSVYAPAQIRKGSSLLIQVTLHTDQYQTTIENICREADPNSERREYLPLGVELANGDKIAFDIEATTDKVLYRDRKEVMWHGNWNKCSFNMYVPEELESKNICFTIVVSVNGMPLGEMMFVTAVEETRNSHYAEIRNRTYEKIFISYAHEDEDTVKLLAKGFQAQGVEYFFDRDVLGPGAVFSREISDFIYKADLFILCWSKHTERSKYVEKECEMALQRAFPQVPKEKAELVIKAFLINPYSVNLPEKMKNIYNFVKV